MQRYFELGLSSATRRTYQAGISRFNQFCSAYNVTNPLPVSQTTLCSFVSYLANRGLAHATIKTYLAALRHLQVSKDLPEPRATPMPKLAVVERGIMKAKADTVSRPRLLITADILRRIRGAWAYQASDFDTIMFWAVCCTAFFGFFRMGEVTARTVDGSGEHCIRMEDVAVDDHANPTVVRINLRSSKTDQFGKGVEVFLGKTDGEELCPVAALLAYLAVRGGAEGPLFRLQDGRYLTSVVVHAQNSLPCALLSALNVTTHRTLWECLPGSL